MTVIAVGTGALLHSFDGPAPTGATRTNLAGTGSMSVTIVGSDFGWASYSGENRVGDSGVEATNWVSDSAMRGKAGAGSWSQLKETATVAMSLDTLAGILSYEHTWSLTSNVAGTGSTSVTIVGTGLSTTNPSVRSRVGGSDMEATWWMADSSIHGKVSSGSLASHAVVLTIEDEQETALAALTYDRSWTLATNVAATGATSVTVVGSGLGTQDGSVSGRVSMTSTEATVWHADSSMHAKVSSGSLSSRTVVLTSTDEAESAAGSLTYDRSWSLVSNITATGCDCRRKCEWHVGEFRVIVCCPRPVIACVPIV